MADTIYGPSLGTDPECDGFDGAAIRCPSCGFNYVHPVAVEVNAGGSSTRVDATGTHRRVEPAAERGVRITLVFRCEDGHTTRQVVQFHKGMSFMSVRASDDPASDTIWRD